MLSLRAMSSADAVAHSEDRYVLVRSGGERFAIPVSSVVTVLRDLATHPVPGAWAPLIGLAQHAGEPLVVIDLLERLDRRIGGHQITIVVRRPSATGAVETVGLAVDEAERILTIADSEPTDQWGPAISSIATLDGQPIRVLNPALLGDDPGNDGEPGSRSARPK